MRSYWVRVGPQSSVTRVLLKGRNLEEDTHTHTWRRLCEDKGGGWDDASRSQGTPKMASTPPAARGKAWSRLCLTFV